jgi:hypothetical protein
MFSVFEKSSSINLQKKYVETLDEDIKDSLRWYTSDEYVKFNRYLRTEKKERNSVFERHVHNIDFAFLNAPALQESIVVYKGVIGSKVFSDKAYISTSRYYDNTLKFAETYKNCCVMEITVSKNSKVLPLQSLTEYKDEEEILLDRDGTLICTSQYVKKVKKESDMNMLVCVYTKGIEIQTMKDVKEAILELSEEERDKILIDRILSLVDEGELELYDSDKELKNYIKSLYSQIEPSLTISKDLLDVILNRLKSKYGL